MSKADVLHELYEQCKDIDADDVHDLIVSAESPEEADFISGVTDLILREKQRSIIADKVF